MAEAAPIPEYRCLICTKPYNEPRELPCGHTFCCRCLTSYIDAEHVTADEDRHYFPCPVCDTPSAPNDVSTDVSTWAECFPVNNFYLNTTAEASDVHLCAPCQRGKDSSPAEVWCTDCGEKLCKQCRIYHERSKALSKHRLVSISSIVGGICDVMVNGICPSHDEKQLDVYCVDHSAVCCSVCVSVSHRHCNNVQPIEDVIRKTNAGQHTRKTEWKELKEETKKMLDDDDLGMTLLTSKEKEVSAEMTNRIQQAKDKLDNLNATFQSELIDKFDALRQKISDRRMCVNTFHTNAENSYLLMSHLDQQISERHRFLLREQTKNQISGHYRRMDQNTKKQPNRFDVTLKLGTTIIDEIMKMTTLGNIDVTSSISDVTQNANVCIGTMIGTLLLTPSASTLADATSTSDLACSLQYLTVQTTPVKTAVDVWTGSVSCVKTVDRSILGESVTPWLTGGIYTDNNELLVTDNNNKRLLLFDDTYSYVREFNIDGHPSDIVRGHASDELFVAVNQTKILRYKLRNGQLTLINKIHCPEYTWGMAILGDNILLVTSDSVKVMTVDGKVTKSIRKGKHYTHLATSPSSATVYHIDNNDVVCRRLDSDTEVYRYKDPGLKNPVGIGLDRDDNVYVCDCQSGNIHLVSPDGLRGRVLVSTLSTINCPWCVLVHPTKQEFVITSDRESTSLVVYSFNSK